MRPLTIGRDDYGSKSVPIQYVDCDTLENLDIKNECFLLLSVCEGEICFQINDTIVEAHAPCLVSFDESASPRLIRQSDAVCDGVYFHPSFLNVNMTFPLVHAEGYPEIATLHDMFLLKPFTDRVRHVFPLYAEHADNVRRMFASLKDALTCQSDWYWSCRSRSYFMEILLFLERLYGLGERDGYGSQRLLRDPQLKDAVVYIENSYREEIKLDDIVKAAAVNHSTLTKIFKSELGMTPIEYLWHHRLTVAKKFLEFTSLPVKEISVRCGFKTVQHFTRKFESAYGDTPTKFRTDAVAKRKAYF